MPWLSSPGRIGACSSELHRYKANQCAPRFQASNSGGYWDVVKIDTGEVQGFAFTHQAAMRFVDAMEAGTASKSGALA